MLVIQPTDGVDEAKFANYSEIFLKKERAESKTTKDLEEEE